MILDLDIEPFVAHLRALPSVREVRWRRDDAASTRGRLDVTTPEGSARYIATVMEWLGQHPSLVADRLIAERRHAGPTLLLTRSVGPALGRRLAAGNVQFLDRSGNCHLVLGDHAVDVFDRPATAAPATTPDERAEAAVLFTLLARPDVPVPGPDELARAAATDVAAAERLLTGLGAAGFVRDALLTRREDLERRWLDLYGGRLRPDLVLGCYRPRDPRLDRLDSLLEAALRAVPRWAWGGGAAVARLTGHYRGPQTIVHLDDLPPRPSTTHRRAPRPARAARVRSPDCSARVAGRLPPLAAPAPRHQRAACLRLRSPARSRRRPPRPLLPSRRRMNLTALQRAALVRIASELRDSGAVLVGAAAIALQMPDRYRHQTADVDLVIPLVASPALLTAHFAQSDQRDRAVVITSIGHRDHLRWGAVVGAKRRWAVVVTRSGCSRSPSSCASAP